MSMVDTIRSTFVPIHREGHKFIVAFFAVSIILGLLWQPLFWVGLVLTLWCVYFFRDPERLVPQNADQAISPADGKISLITMGVPPAELGLSSEPMLQDFGLHECVQLPCEPGADARYDDHIVHRDGKFLNADLDKASEENERNGLVIDTVHGRIGVVQVAGLVARRIVCWARPDSPLEAGERFGLIRFGSRLDVYLPEGFTPRVTVGQTAIAGETVLADFGGAAGPALSRRM